MTPVFLETVGLIAVWDFNDQWHSDAESVFRSMVETGRSIITTTLVLYECGNAASRRSYRREVVDLRLLLASRQWLIEPTANDVESAWANYGAARAGEAGIVDHVSFAVMRRLGITEAFTNDAHFKAVGFTPLF